MKNKYFVYAVFFASGISGLMYEVVWLRMLARVTGVTIYATATVLAAYMAGLALGSFLLGRFVDKRRDGLRIYAVLEFLVAIAALLVPVLFSLSIPLYQYVYQATGENLTITTVVRAVVSFLSVLIPTTVMGGTLPVLTSFLVKKDSLFGKNFSILYGLNTLGAVCGVLLSGFITIGAFGEKNTIYIGVAINLLVAAVAYVLFLRDPTAQAVPAVSPELEPTEPKHISPYSDTIRNVILVAFAVSGFTSLAYEVIWTRQLILFLQTSIYAFSGMLAIYLFGVAFGSIAMNNIVDRLKSPLAVFGFLELAVGILSVVNLHLFYPLDSPTARAFFGPYLSIVAAIVIVFPLTFVLGLIFPVAAMSYAESVEKTGSSVGRLYGVNTVGSILGSIAAGFLLIPLWGSTSAIIFLACINIVLAAILFMLEASRTTAQKLYFYATLLVGAVLIIGAVGTDPFLAIIERRVYLGTPTLAEKAMLKAHYGTEIAVNKEGLEGTITAYTTDYRKVLWINGVGMTHLCTETKLMAHLPLFFVKDPKDFLIICFGMGTTVKSASVYPDLNVTAVELVPECFDNFSYFHPEAGDLLKKSNIKLVANDGRNYLLLTSHKYDAISIDPAPPIWSAGTVNLYTREFFELCRKHLKPNGVLSLWFPGGTNDDNLAIIRTFCEVFPEFSVWAGPRGWGFFCIGTLKEIPLDELRLKMDQALKNPAIVADLSEYDENCIKPEQLLKLRAIDKKKIRQILQRGVLITDNNPYTEFYLWRHLFSTY